MVSQQHLPAAVEGTWSKAHLPGGKGSYTPFYLSGMQAPQFFPVQFPPAFASGSCSTQHKTQMIWKQKKQKTVKSPPTQVQDSLLWHGTLTARQLSPCCPLPLHRIFKGSYICPSSIFSKSDISPFFIITEGAEMGDIFSAWVGIEKIRSLCSV